MKSRSALFTLFVLIGILLLAACGGGAPATQALPSDFSSRGLREAAATEAPATRPAAAEAATQAPAIASDQKAGGGGEPGDTMPPMSTAAAYEIANSAGDLTVIERSNRMILKNADIRLMVKDTDVAIDRATQVIGDAGGYIVSSRVWYQDYYGNNLKYAAITIGVPVTEFEKVLVRLRGLAVKVVDEKAAGDDVTDQYVDLQSQLTNLEATRARIQEFLKDAKTVDEALRINQELANIESQVEQIKGRMNYLNDRSAYSTVTINFEPEFPVLTPMPTLTPTPTATPAAWSPGHTFGQAKSTVTVMYQGIADLLIWVGVVVLPIILPPALILWVVWKLVTRKSGKTESVKG